MTKMNLKINALNVAIGLALCAPFVVVNTVDATIAASHVYHNHMPNFWPYYDTSSYKGTAVGAPIRYTYDGQVFNLKLNPPANYTYFLASGKPMPHDDLETYYSHHAKQAAYSSWPAATARANNSRHPLSQTQVTMSAAVVNNVQSFAELGLLNFGLGWANDWKSTVGTVKTTNGFNALEPIHFTGHHSMGPLVGPQYFLKDLIYQNVTLQQDYFLGDKFKSSKGFFPTELGFSERLIPTLKKLGVEWSVMGNNHFSRALRDYPYSVSDPAFDTVISPPNRADLQNTSEVGDWVTINMAHEKQNVVNKFPFAAIPHWVQYVNPETGEVSKLAGIPVDQNGSWLEGWEGAATPATSKLFDFEEFAGDRTMYFVIAHDGDNSQGRAGSFDTWLNSGNEYATDGVVGMGIQEYLKAHPIPADDIQHVQDGSWIDTRDSSSDPTWYHWHIPMGVWKGQFADFNEAMGTEFENPTNFEGLPFGHAVSMEYGYHYLERNFALLQAAINYAETAEQIWLDAHPNYWSPKTEAERQVTYEGNQLNPYMMSYPVKGDEANDYKGGANPAELGWYFLISSIDSGFGYYDENTDDNVKPTLGFNQSLFFTQPYVEKNLAKDKTGPSMWWVQRYPYNPGSANASKAEGWTVAHADNEFAIYTYAYDVSGIKDVKVMVRPHKDKRMSATDIAPRVYDPKKFAGQPNVDVDQVGEWKAYATKKRDLTPNIDGVDWQTFDAAKLQKVVKAQKIGDTYYAYISDYRDQLVDYYMEATDNLGNVTKSEIQSVYVGAGRYNKTADGYVEDVNGEIEGTHMFFSDKPIVRHDAVTIYVKPADSSVGSVFADYKDNGRDTWNSVALKKITNTDYFKTTVQYVSEAGCADIKVRNDGATTSYPSNEGKCLAKGAYTIDEGGNFVEGAPDIYQTATVYFKPATTLARACMHYRGTPDETGKGWTAAPGTPMTSAEEGWFKLDLQLDSDKKGMEFLFNDCGGQWFKASNGGNFLTNTIADYSVDGTKMTEGSPFGSENKAPKAVVSPAQPTIKKGDSVTLDASGSTDSDGKIVKYSWSNGESTAKITVSPTETTTYSVVVTDDKGATNSRSVIVTVENAEIVTNKAPVAKVLASTSTITKGESVVLDGSASTDEDGKIASYSWKDATGKVISTEAKVSVAPKATTTYTLTVTDDKNATSSASVAITVSEVELPTVTISTSVNAQALAVNFTTELSAELANATYKWDFGDGQTGEGASVTHAYAKAGSYTVKVTVTDGKVTIDNTRTVTLTGPVLAVKAKVAASKTSINAGESVVLDASASENVGSYLWDTGDKTAKITVTPTATKNYCVTVTGVNKDTDTACVKVDVQSVDVNHAPKAVINSDKVGNKINVGERITLNASASTDEDGDELSYAWNDGSVTSAITVNPEADTVYTVTVTDTKGASDVASIKVTVVKPEIDNPPVVVLSPKEQTLLLGRSVELSSVGSYDDKGIKAYHWYLNGTELSEENGRAYTFKPEAVGTYEIGLTIEDTVGQLASAKSTITVNKDPQQTPYDLTAKLDFNAPAVVYYGTEVTFDASASKSSDGIDTYVWFVNNNKQPSTTATMKFKFEALGNNVVTLKVIDKSGHEDTMVVEVPVAVDPAEGYLTENDDVPVYPKPEFSFASTDENGETSSVNASNALDGQELKVQIKRPIEISLGNYKNTVRYYVYKKLTNLVASGSASDRKLCYFDKRYHNPECGIDATEGDEFLEASASAVQSFILDEAGDYEIQVMGTDDVSNVVSLSKVKVAVTADAPSNAGGNNGGGSSGGSSGGAFDPLSLLMLGGLAALLRRRKVQK